MTKQILAAVALVLLLSVPGLARGAEEASEFGDISVRFEQNATDGDVELVFEILGNDDGLVKLTVVAPDGETVIDFTAPVAAKMGMREFVFESPEPRDIKGLMSAYPEGVYRFAATTVGGEQLKGTSTLSHKLPGTASVQWSKAGEETVDLKNPKITWKPPAERLKGMIIEIGQGELKVSLKVELPGSATSFTLPSGFAVAGKEYDLGIGTVSENGNVSFVETTFTAVGKD